LPTSLSLELRLEAVIGKTLGRSQLKGVVLAIIGIDQIAYWTPFEQV
jgi:hypothetical protein